MRVRYVGDAEEVTVSPVGHDPFTARRLEWVDVDKDVALSLNQQDTWELESVKKAQRTRAANEAADSGEEG